MFSRSLLIAGGVALLLVAIGGLVAWVTGFTFLMDALLDDVPFFLESDGHHIEIPGRAIGLLAVALPLAAAFAAFWLLRLAFARHK